MKKNLFGLLCALLFVQPLCAQENDSVKEAVVGYVFGTLEEPKKEAAVREVIANTEDILQAKIDDVPIFEWVLNNVGIKDDLARKSANVAEQLVAKGANVNAMATNEMPLLIKYAMFAQLAPMKFLAEHDVKVNIRDKEDQRTALHWVALLNELDATAESVAQYLEAAKLLIAAKAEVDARDKSGNTPLHSATFLGNLKMAQFLIDNGADINAKNADGYSVLGNVLARKEETWANDKEKAALEPVIELLKKLGAKDERPTD